MQNFGQRSKSWSRTRIISRRLAGAVKCIAMTSELLTYLWSRALFIGAARHVQTCVCMRSPILHEFRCLKYCAQGKGFHIVRAASQHAFEKVFQIFHPYFTGRIFISDLAATQPSVLQELRAFFILFNFNARR